MLNVRKYLPSMEDFDSLPDTLANDISTDGENTYVAGIPEELIQPVENSEQGNEGDGTIVDNLQAKNEETEAVKESEDDGSGGEEDESLETTQTEDEPDTTDDEKETNAKAEELDEEEKVVEATFAIESYEKLLQNAGPHLTQQSAAFMAVGVARLERQFGEANLGLEDFDATPYSARQTVATETIRTLLTSLRNRINGICK
jgi:hypothetical protein